MQNLDLSILEKIPEPNLKVIMEIEPLAPLSMVSELPGSYYKTLKSPDKKMLCGLFESILGWHIDLADRKAIIKELTILRKKQAKKNPQLEFVDRTKGSTYNPLLMDYFDVENVQPVISKVVFYDDLWNKAYRREDVSGSQAPHPKGTFNIDYGIIPEKRKLERDTKNNNKVDDTALGQFFLKHKTEYPMFYSTPTKREYISMEGKYRLLISIDTKLFECLRKHTQSNNLCYLGNSEGWIDVKFEEI
jgi:CRISPR-associated protein Cas5